MLCFTEISQPNWLLPDTVFLASSAVALRLPTALGWKGGALSGAELPELLLSMFHFVQEPTA